MSNPTGLIAKSGLEVLTWGTPNGHKATILLEELKQAYGLEYVWQGVNIHQGVQKQLWYTKLNSNGRIPALVDHDHNDLAIMEGGAILSYLCRRYDPEHKFTFVQDPELSQVEQWVAWLTGGIGPMQAQSNHFYRMAKERMPYPTQRYLGDVERLYGVLDKALDGKEYLVGDKYTIADIATYVWVNGAYFGGIDLKQFPNVERWWVRIDVRPAVQKGTAIPEKPPVYNEMHLKRLKGDSEFAAQEERLAEHGRKAKEQYDYQYESP